MSFKPWLLLPAKVAHDLSPLGLRFLGAFRATRIPQWRKQTWKNIEFQNPLGIAGGVDKDASAVGSWWKFGSGLYRDRNGHSGWAKTESGPDHRSFE